MHEIRRGQPIMQSFSIAHALDPLQAPRPCPFHYFLSHRWQVAPSFGWGGRYAPPPPTFLFPPPAVS